MLGLKKCAAAAIIAGTIPAGAATAIIADGSLAATGIADGSRAGTGIAGGSRAGTIAGRVFFSASVSNPLSSDRKRGDRTAAPLPCGLTMFGAFAFAFARSEE